MSDIHCTCKIKIVNYQKPLLAFRIYPSRTGFMPLNPTPSQGFGMASQTRPKSNYNLPKLILLGLQVAAPEIPSECPTLKAIADFPIPPRSSAVLSREHQPGPPATKEKGVVRPRCPRELEPLHSRQDWVALAHRQPGRQRTIRECSLVDFIRISVTIILDLI